MGKKLNRNETFAKKALLIIWTFLLLVILCKNLIASYHTFSGRPMELAIIWTFIIANTIVFIIHKLFDIPIKYSNFLDGLEYFITFCGIFSLANSLFITDNSPLCLQISKIIALAYYITSAIGCIVLLISLTESLKTVPVPEELPEEAQDIS